MAPPHGFSWIVRSDHYKDFQCGFRFGKSVHLALDNFKDNLTHLKNNYKHVAAISLDIKSAFDNIQYSIINHELSKHHIPSNLCLFIESINTNRQAIVSTDQGYVTKNISKGCPQGSCIGPTAWNLTINSLLNIHSENYMIQAFADDLIILTFANSRRNLEEITNNSLNEIHTWLIQNALNLSIEKTVYIHFYNTDRSAIFKINNIKIKHSNHFKYLGVVIDKKLNWGSHINLLKQKSKTLLNSLQKINQKSWGINQKARKLIYNTVIIPALAHGCSLWATNISPRIYRTLQSIQRKFLLNMSRAYYSTPTAALQVLTNIPPLAEQIMSISCSTTVTHLQKDAKFNNITYNTLDYEKKLKIPHRHPSFHTINKITLVEQNNFDFNRKTNYFTDGSKTNTGTAFAFLNITHSQSYTLDKENSVFQAEQLAIFECIKYIKSTENFNNNDTYVIWSDSKSSISSILDFGTNNRISFDIQQELQHTSIQISWIKAHSNRVGNEKADDLAKQSTRQPKNYVYPLPVSYLKRRIKDSLLTKWQFQWNNSDRGRRLFKIINNVTFFKTIPPKQVIWFLTGHGPFPTFFNYLHITDTDLCTCGQQGSPEHYLTSCSYTVSWHSRQPSPTNLEIWQKTFITNNTLNKRLITVMNFLADNDYLLKF
nr:uncharacterized protein LOC122272395 [Parasteatoda tepidariorum]